MPARRRPSAPTTRRRAGRRRLLSLVAAAALIVSACTSGGDEATPGDTSPTVPGETTVPATGGAAPADPGAGPRWDIDAALQADPNCAAPATGDPLIIGYAADLGELGGFADGPASETAVHLGQLINCSGGLNGRPVQVDVKNIAGTPTVSRTAIQELIQGGAHVLLGPPFADPGFRILQVTNGQIPVIFTGSTEPALADDSDLSFLVAFNDTQGSTAAAQFAQSQGWRTAITLTSSGPYFGYNPEVFRGAFTAAGGQVVAEIPFAPVEQQDFTEIVAQIQAARPDVVYSPMLADQWVAFKEQMEAAGLGDVALLGSDSFEATFGYSLPGTDGIYHVTHADPAADSRLETLITSYTAASGKPRPGAPSMVALTGDAFAVIADAYLRVGSTDPLALGQAISTASGVQGVTGVLTYNGSGAPTKPIYVHQVRDGQAALAYTISN